ncbi:MULTISPECIES: phosphate ABC transporter ATP-binding protein PstB [Campylobacter]|uniref:phosphate ABC transporter ATP-binding protein PstB n=1 Tax=Campylobacter TaxID=194 RepID=UPI000A33E1E7|nr:MULTISPECIES: phosphate ABC transporter ATP-binding protein PstB [unclassified Campylobacter]MCR8697017.1 phosphate ABC transporter ATP-binding protein PstB [Campylobacter sp. RM19073]
MKRCFDIKKLNLHYGTFHALKNINMEITKGEVTAFIGPSGCGKSTFIKTLNRMNDLVDGCKIDGEILFHDRDIYSKDYDINLLRKRVGMVFQKPNPFAMSIYDNITFGPKTHGIKDKDTLDSIVEKSLKDAALWDDLKDRLHSLALGLSGGQQQRLCIARTLAVDPEVILMDEPTSALDPISTAKIEELILKLKKDYTIIIVTHNIQQAHRISDKTAFFLMGEVIEHDDTKKIFNKPKNKKTQDYVMGKFG